MKTAAFKKFNYFIAVFVLLFLGVEQGFAQRNIPYPIIFIHGLNSDNNTWQQDGPDNDVIDYLKKAGLSNGGNLNICLSYARSADSFTTKKEDDVRLLSRVSAGDFYTINFNTRSNGASVTNSPKFANFALFSSTATSFTVNEPTQFLIGDIIRIGDEYMKVTGLNGNTLSVKRPVLGSKAQIHFPNDAGLNLSLESNQSSIVKQAWGLKSAIDSIKKVTGAKKVILVGHSMGGLAAREYIQSYSNDDVAKIVTIGTPHQGADVTKLPDFFLNWADIDGQSDAVRDLRTTFSKGFGTIPGLYLFGRLSANESEIPDHYYSKDVDGNGEEDDTISGLNYGRGYTKYSNIARTWIVSDLKQVLTVILPGHNDGVVNITSQYPDANTKDTLMTNRLHITYGGFIGESLDYNSLLRGLDEPGIPELAYEVGLNSTTKGFITFRQGDSELLRDTDLYKIVVKSRSSTTINLSETELITGIKSIDLLNSDLSPHHPNFTDKQVTAVLDPGVYYIRITGRPAHGVKPNYDNASYKYPYTLTVKTTTISPPQFSVSPDATLPFYDVVLGKTRDKVITLSNTGSTPLSITSMAIANTTQYAVVGPTSLTIEPGKSQAVTIRYIPKILGPRNNVLTINSNSAESPVKEIALRGTAVDHPTKTLVVTKDVSFNYGNVNITTLKYNVFTLQNTGSDPLTVSALTITGPSAPTFKITSAVTLPFQLQPGETKQITLRFLPTTIGVKNAALVISSNADSTPEHSIALLGNGTNSIYTGVGGSLVAYEYWFDNNYSAKVSAAADIENFAGLSANLPTNGLAIGAHALRFRYKDIKGRWSAVVSNIFYKSPLLPTGERDIVVYEYWFDSNYAKKVRDTISATKISEINSVVDTKLLAPGVHTFYVRYKDNKNVWSSIVATVFSKIPIAPAGERKMLTYEYWFDDNYAAKVAVPLSASQTINIDAQADATSLPVGTHIYHYRYKDDLGVWSSVGSSNFYKIKQGTGQPGVLTAYRYWFDADDAHKITRALTESTGLVKLSKYINASKLTGGQHTIYLQFKDAANAWSAVAANTFTVATDTPMLKTTALSTSSINQFSQEFTDKADAINTPRSIIAYPVPFQDVLNVDLGSTNVKNVLVKIYNTTRGTLVFSTEFHNVSGSVPLNVANLPTGVYALHLNLDGWRKVIKIWKK
jgi:hypothetical protein